MIVLKHFSWFRYLKDFFKYPHWFKKCPREGKQNGSKRLLAVKNKFMSLRLSMEDLKVFKMNSTPTIANESCTTDFHKTRIESFWKPHSQSVDVSFLDVSWDFQFGKVSKGTTETMLWQGHSCLLGSLFRGAWQSNLLPAGLREAKSLVKCNVFCFSCLYWFTDVDQYSMRLLHTGISVFQASVGTEWPLLLPMGSRALPWRKS